LIASSTGLLSGTNNSAPLFFNLIKAHIPFVVLKAQN
jgi:hypothetical protein